jgi:serine/threonine protein kinase
MFHIGIATQHPPLPEKGQLSELGIDFVEKCLDIDPMKRPTAGELMEHPWIVQFSQEIAREMNSHNEGIEYIQEEEATQGQIYNLDETPEIYTDDSMEPTYENQQEFEEQQQQMQSIRKEKKNIIIRKRTKINIKCSKSSNSNKRVAHPGADG